MGSSYASSTSNDIDQLVIEAIVHVANGIGIPTVAEYVSSEQLARRLLDLGVCYGQGFYLGRPTAIEEQPPRGLPAALDAQPPRGLPTAHDAQPLIKAGQ